MLDILIKVAVFILVMGLLTTHAHAQEQKKNKEYREAILAGGCFWCIESALEPVAGVKEVISGYTGGRVKNPTYEEVSTGKSGHYEAVKVIYDPEKVNYKTILFHFWRQIDPTDEGGQFADRGPQYRTAIFYKDEEQKKIAEKSKKALAESGKFKKPIVTKILPAEKFYIAEKYHQDYYKKNPLRYKLYKHHSGREEYIQETWE